jgi:hypothetical protein
MIFDRARAQPGAILDLNRTGVMNVHKIKRQPIRCGRRWCFVS